MLLHSSRGGKLEPGIVKWMASLYSVSIHVIYRIWNQVKETGDACHKRTQNCGRKRVQVDIATVREVPLSKRQTIRSLAH